MEELHACHACTLREYFSSVVVRIDGTKKQKQTKRRKNFFGLARKRERNASWKRDQNLQETDINIFKLISDDD